MVLPNSAIPTNGYVCVMKCKQAELDALEGVSANRFVPLFEVSGGRYAPLAKKWTNPDDVVWVQGLNIDQVGDDEHATLINQGFQMLRDEGLCAVPVVSVEEPYETVAAITAIIVEDRRGLVLRLDAEEILVLKPADLAMIITNELSRYSTSVSDTDLVVDASLIRDSVPARVATVESCLASLPHLHDWRNVVVAMSAFPTDMGAMVPKNSVQPLPRSDQQAYTAVVGRGVPRHITYSDFAVGQPTYADAPFTPIPSIKYTVGASWVVHRGNSRSNPSPQYVDLARAVAGSGDFRGSTFSAGDAYIASVATGSGGPGNATKYLFAATSHHIQHVLDSLATHGAP